MVPTYSKKDELGYELLLNDNTRTQKNGAKINNGINKTN